MRCPQAPRLTLCLAGALVLVATEVRAQAARPPERMAVLALGRPAGELAQGVRAALLGQNAPVLSQEDTRAGLRGGGPGGGQVQDTARLQERLAEVDRVYLASRYKDALGLVEEAIQALAADPELTPQKTTLLRTFRLRAANILLTLAGSAETGRATTLPGRRAKEFLVDILRAEPALALAASEFTPRLRLMLDHARSDLATLPKGSLGVESQPSGIPVYFEGQELGVTPLNLARVAPHGTYRVWLQQEGRRSVQRVVTLGAEPVRLAVDFGVEAQLDAVSAGVRAPELELTPELLRRVAERVGAQTLVLVNQVDVSGGTAGAVVVYQVDEGVLRRGEVDLKEPDAVRLLAEFAGVGAADPRVRRPGLALPPPPSGRLAVLPVESLGSGFGVEALESSLRETLAAVPGLDVATAAETLPRLQEARAQDGVCPPADLACRAALGRRLEVDHVVLGRVYAVAGETRLETWLLRAADGSVVRHLEGRPLPAADPASGARDAALLLVVPSRFPGALEVRCTLGGTRVWLDGVEEGVTPLKSALAPLPPGTHLLRLAAPGLEPASLRVRVEPGQAAVAVAAAVGNRLTLSTPRPSLRPTLAQRAPPPVETAGPARWPLALVGAGAAGVALALPGVLVGAAAAVAGGALLLAYPRRESVFLLLPGENQGLAQVRVYLTAGAVPGGLLAAAGALGLGAVSAVVLAAGAGTFLVRRD